MTTLNLNLHRQFRTSRRLLCVRTFIDHALVLSMFMFSFICVILCGLFDWKRIYSFFYRLFMYCCWRDNYQEGGEIPLTNITTPRFYRFPRPLPVFQTSPRFYRFLRPVPVFQTSPLVYRFPRPVPVFQTSSRVYRFPRPIPVFQTSQVVVFLCSIIWGEWWLFVLLIRVELLIITV